jgi:hypothetical protein
MTDESDYCPRNRFLPIPEVGPNFSIKDIANAITLCLAWCRCPTAHARENCTQSIKPDPCSREGH